MVAVETNDFVPELDRWPLWQVVKSFDLAYRNLMPLLEGLDITVHKDPETGQEYISKTEFKELLYDVAS